MRVREGRDALGSAGIRSCQIPQWKGQWGDAVFWTEGWKVAAAPAKLSKDQKRTAGTVPQLPQGSTHSADEKTDNQRRTWESSWGKAKFSAGSLCNLPGVSRRQGTAEPGTAAARTPQRTPSVHTLPASVKDGRPLLSPPPPPTSGFSLGNCLPFLHSALRRALSLTAGYLLGFKLYTVSFTFSFVFEMGSFPVPWMAWNPSCPLSLQGPPTSISWSFSLCRHTQP